MGENSNIQWTTHTFNPWEGCQRVSPGCQHCYAEARNHRFAGADSSKVLWGAKAPRRRTSPANWRKPLAWNRAAQAAGERHRVFCASLADVFEDRPELAPWRLELLELIRTTPSLDWLLLTKRPESIQALLREARRTFSTATPLHTWLTSWLDHGQPPANVWLGTTVEDQERADERIPALLYAPAAVRFLSCEPLLERVDLSKWLNVWGVSDATGKTECSAIDWVIIGGESGHGARPFDTAWARDLVRQCRSAGVAPFVKQLGARPEDGGETLDAAWRRYESGKGPMRLVDPAGGDMAEWPADLRVREFPTCRAGA